MNHRLRTRSTPAASAAAALLIATLAPAAALAYHGDAMPPEAEARMLAEQAGAPLTRDEVLAELALASRAGTLTPGGEIGDTDAVLASRERFIVAQAAEIVARHEAEQAARIAALEEAARVAAADAASRAAAAAQPGEAMVAAAPAADVDAADSLSASESLVTAPAPAAPLPEPKPEVRPEAIKNEERPDLSEAPATDRD